ncbi:Ankyrin repeat and KH domain-containing protein 1 [Hondaea fermentalgiana]|uniref:Ankyrin repeat and KH domain-containing protein 1 n=1 Tax=Hondaea fermentalgiana TaxID=2315210 RepID=A0A2R5GST3_9STRA|nr:Ankyrin repeat and KH domain-containing protein 1 [Hondaea fermentalgiana]|eukprot:GBG33922.1 Ankyrin repeat and KH domain-containing protein 1 [Hondaea fermentalgiana]
MASMRDLINNGDLASVKQAVQYDPALLNAMVTTANDTPLMWALSQFSGGQIAIAQWLIEHDAELDLQGIDGRTALMTACRHGHSAIAQLLIERDAKLNLKDNQGKTALTYARIYDQPDTVQLLNQLGVKHEHVQKEEWTTPMECGQDSNQRPTALEAVRHEAFKVKPVEAALYKIRLNVRPVTEGVSYADVHSMCKMCVCDLVHAAAEPQACIPNSQAGSMHCLMLDCTLIIS